MSEEEKTVQLEVRSRSDKGFRRAGRHFGPDPVEDSFTEEAAQRLEQEPQLLVRRLDGSKASKPDPKLTENASTVFSQHQPSGVRSTSVSTDERLQSNPEGAPPPPAAPGATGSTGGTGATGPIEPQPAERDAGHAKRRL